MLDENDATVSWLWMLILGAQYNCHIRFNSLTLQVLIGSFEILANHSLEWLSINHIWQLLDYGNGNKRAATVMWFWTILLDEEYSATVDYGSGYKRIATVICSTIVCSCEGQPLLWRAGAQLCANVRGSSSIRHATKICTI